jgi:hypothetical protein
MRASNTAMRPACLNSPSELTTNQRKMLWSHVLHTTLSQYNVTLSEQWHGLCHIDHCSCYRHKNSKFCRNYYTKFVLCMNMCLIIFIRMSKTYILAGWLVHLCCENSLVMALGAETCRCLFMSCVLCYEVYLLDNILTVHTGYPVS